MQARIVGPFRGAICVPGGMCENSTDGVRPGIRASGALASAAMVFGQLAALASFSSPFCQR